MSQHNIIAAVTAILLALLSSASANEKAEKLGAYFFGNEILRALKEKCSYAMMKTSPKTEQMLVAEVTPYLTMEDKRELLEFLNGPRWTRAKSDSNKMVSGMLEAGARDGIDPKTACGLALGSLSQVIAKANKDWEAFLISSRGHKDK